MIGNYKITFLSTLNIFYKVKSLFGRLYKGKLLWNLSENIRGMRVSKEIRKPKTDEVLVKAVKTEAAVDPTGCGDAYRGGFLTGLVNGCSYEECGQMGSVASVFVVEQYGTQKHAYSRAEFVKRYQENYGSLPAFLNESVTV